MIYWIFEKFKIFYMFKEFYEKKLKKKDIDVSFINQQDIIYKNVSYS